MSAVYPCVVSILVVPLRSLSMAEYIPLGVCYIAIQMNITGTATRIGAFAVLLVLVFAAASFAGSRIDPSVDEPEQPRRGRLHVGHRPGVDRLRTNRPSSTFRITARRRRHGRGLRRRARAAHAPDRRPPRLRAASSTCIPSSSPTAAGRSSVDAARAPATYRVFADFATARRVADPGDRPVSCRAIRAAAAAGGRATRPTPATATRSRSTPRRAGGDTAPVEFTVSRNGRAGRRRRALPRRRRPPGRPARERPGLPPHPSRGRAGRPRPDLVRGRVPDRGPLPPLPPVQAPRRGAHGRVHPRSGGRAASERPLRRRGRELDLPVEGMTCASCANRIERKLNELDGRRGDASTTRPSSAVGHLRRRRGRRRASCSAPSRPPATRAELPGRPEADDGAPRTTARRRAAPTAAAADRLGRARRCRSS